MPEQLGKEISKAANRGSLSSKLSKLGLKAKIGIGAAAVAVF